MSGKDPPSNLFTTDRDFPVKPKALFIFLAASNSLFNPTNIRLFIS